jgi:hypothetical protein
MFRQGPPGHRRSLAHSTEVRRLASRARLRSLLLARRWRGALGQAHTLAQHVAGSPCGGKRKYKPRPNNINAFFTFGHHPHFAVLRRRPGALPRSSRWMYSGSSSLDSREAVSCLPVLLVRAAQQHLSFCNALALAFGVCPPCVIADARRRPRKHFDAILKFTARACVSAVHSRTAG